MSWVVCQETFDGNTSKEEIYATIDRRCVERTGSRLARGIEFLDGVADNQEAAKRRIQTHPRSPYDKGVAVQFFAPKNPGASKRITDLTNRYTELRRKYREMEKRFYFADTKAEFIRCKRCGSKLARKHLSSNECPVCGEDLRPATVLKAIAKANKMADKAGEKMATASEAIAKTQSRKVMWLVEYEYHVRA